MVKIARGLKHYARMVTSVSKNAKKGPKTSKKATIWTYTQFSKESFALTNLILIKSNDIRKKCDDISLGLIFSHLVKSKHHFRIYSQQLHEIKSGFFQQINHLAAFIIMPDFARKSFKSTSNFSIYLYPSAYFKTIKV